MTKDNEIKNLIIYQEPGRFGGWPANHGIWQWGDEILVGFERAFYQANDKDHSIVREKSPEPGLARSMDGGETWMLEQPDALARRPEEAVAIPEEINFGDPNIALKCSGSTIFISYQRGSNWQGPYRLPDFGMKLTSRTDYLIQGPRECLFFISAFEPRVEAGLQDRAFCLRTIDGGRNFDILSWLTGEPVAIRSVMPSTVQCSKNHLISVMRRRHDTKVNEKTKTKCWIDAYSSFDGGCSWDFTSRVADTGDWNGNPPSQVRLADGSLCVAYGYRTAPYGIRAKLSRDEGSTWGDEIILRSDGRTWDLGYPRMVQRSDGKLVTIYYYTTGENPEQHIAATIWDPCAYL